MILLKTEMQWCKRDICFELILARSNVAMKYHKKWETYLEHILKAERYAGLYFTNVIQAYNNDCGFLVEHYWYKIW